MIVLEFLGEIFQDLLIEGALRLLCWPFLAIWRWWQHTTYGRTARAATAKAKQEARRQEMSRLIHSQPPVATKTGQLHHE